MLGQLLVGGIAPGTSPQAGLGIVGLMAAAAQVGMPLLATGDPSRRVGMPSPSVGRLASPPGGRPPSRG